MVEVEGAGRYGGCSPPSPSHGPSNCGHGDDDDEVIAACNLPLYLFSVLLMSPHVDIFHKGCGGKMILSPIY